MNYNHEVAEHHRRIRTDPMYRLQERMDYLELLQEPAWYCPEPDPIGEPRVKPVIYLSLDKKAMELQKRIIALENNSHSDKKRKPDTYTIR